MIENLKVEIEKINETPVPRTMGTSSIATSTLTSARSTQSPARTTSGACYVSPIPQVDGPNKSPHRKKITNDSHPQFGTSLSSLVWTCYCCRYAKAFKTETELEVHHTNEHDEYGDCNICYPWHVWT